MLMPKAAINKDDRLMLRKYNIGASWKPSMMQLEPKATRMKKVSNP
jgi:hypothetical protein